MTPTLPATEAWQPLPAADWNADAARHLLRRAGWTARAEDVARATREGLAATLDRLFPAQPVGLAKPRLVARFEAAVPEMQLQAVKAQVTPEARIRLQRESQERARLGVQELSVKWLAYAAEPASAAVAKWVLFLSDVYVVSAEKVRNPSWLYEHFDILTRLGFGPAPELTKAVSRSPAMVQYLDLGQSQRKAPNENFARELFELFVLGEGNYSEKDIKEAARAFTGYRVQGQNGPFRYVAAQHDPGDKTVFGATGKFSGDDIIELAYSQQAAATFLPRELARFYLSDGTVPAAHLEALGAAWRASGFDLRTLALTFFGSRMFFAPEYRANLIKSPVQFYLGLVQDLGLDVTPIPRMTITPLRQMGQQLFYPPNVRGWVGGRTWINSSTIIARRQFVEQLFTPLDENSLNADEQIELVAARSNGREHFTVGDPLFEPLASQPPAEAAAALAQNWLASGAPPAVREQVAKFIAESPADPKQRLRRLRRAAVTLMQSPEYQLC